MFFDKKKRSDTFLTELAYEYGYSKRHFLLRDLQDAGAFPVTALERRMPNPVHKIVANNPTAQPGVEPTTS